MKPCAVLPCALIFDMDGVLIDSNPFHLRKWANLLTKHHIPYNPADLPTQVLGHRNDHAFRFFFGPGLSKARSRELSEELEGNFRRAFKPHAKPLPGLHALIVECQSGGIPMAVASSAMKKNLEFVIDALGFRPYFQVLVSGDEVASPKPDPEIYLKTAALLGIEPAACVAFEDSFVGIEAAKRAGMLCVGIASTFSRLQLEEETRADWVTSNFEGITLRRLREQFSLAAHPESAPGRAT